LTADDRKAIQNCVSVEGNSRSPGCPQTASMQVWWNADARSPTTLLVKQGRPWRRCCPLNHTCSANQAKQRPEAMLCLTRALLTRDSSEQCPPRLRTTARSASKVSADRHTSAQCHRPSSMHAPEHTPGACSVQILPHALLNTGIEYPQPVEYNVYASQYASRLSQATKRFMTCTHHAWLPTHTASI